MNFKKMLSICKRSKAYFLYDLPDGEQMLSNGRGRQRGYDKNAKSGSAAGRPMPR